MRRRVRFRRPSAAMVVACVALFVALGGTAMAAFVVSSNSQIAPNTIYANPGNANVEALFCPAYTGPQCLDSTPDRVTFPANQFGTWSGAYTASFTAGTYTFNTAMKWPFVVPGNVDANTETTVIVPDYRQQQLTGP